MGNYAMVFKLPYWKIRLEASKTQDEFAQLLNDLPKNPIGLTINDDDTYPVMEHYQALKRFNVEDWYARLKLASTQNEFTDLLEEIPKPDPCGLHELVNSRKVLVVKD